MRGLAFASIMVFLLSGAIPVLTASDCLCFAIGNAGFLQALIDARWTWVWTRSSWRSILHDHIPIYPGQQSRQLFKFIYSLPHFHVWRGAAIRWKARSRSGLLAHVCLLTHALLHTDLTLFHSVHGPFPRRPDHIKTQERRRHLVNCG